MGFVRLFALVALVFGAFGPGGTTLAGPTGPVLDTGEIGGAAYKIEIPANWNHQVVLYSHGYVSPGSANPARDVGDPLTGAFLMNQGYALAGSAYKSTGWAVEDALEDQVALLDYFGRTYGTPEHTIAWGHSLGGMITAGLTQRHPERFDAALPMCGVLAGSVGTWNSGLDAAFVFKTLLAPNSSLQLVNISNPTNNLALAQSILATAQSTPQGRARLALVAAVGDLPGWFSALAPEPDSSDFATREQNQFLWMQQVNLPFLFALRAEMEARARGNPSWNNDVNYRHLLNQSIDKDEVEALYESAGLNLQADLHTLAKTPRISAPRGPVGYLTRNIVFNGEVQTPTLTLHTTGDGLVPNQNEQAYRAIADEPELLRQAFVHRAGHCSFTPAETIAAFQALTRKLAEHEWSGVDAESLNAAAQALGPGFNVLLTGQGVVPRSPEYVAFRPTRFLRPYSVEEP